MLLFICPYCPYIQYSCDNYINIKAGLVMPVRFSYLTVLVLHLSNNMLQVSFACISTTVRFLVAYTNELDAKSDRQMNRVFSM